MLKIKKSHVPKNDTKNKNKINMKKWQMRKLKNEHMQQKKLHGKIVGVKIEKFN